MYCHRMAVIMAVIVPVVVIAAIPVTPTPIRIKPAIEGGPVTVVRPPISVAIIAPTVIRISVRIIRVAVRRIIAVIRRRWFGPILLRWCRPGTIRRRSHLRLHGSSLCGLSPQFATALQHGYDNVAGNAVLLQSDNLGGVRTVGGLRVFDVSFDDLGIDFGVQHFQDLAHARRMKHCNRLASANVSISIGNDRRKR